MPFNKAVEGSLQDRAKYDKELAKKIATGRHIQKVEGRKMDIWAKRGFVSGPEPSRGRFTLDDNGGWDKIG